MSFNLWKYFLEDDVDGFRQYLARATFAHGSARVATASPSMSAFKIGSPGTLATSPKTPTRSRKTLSSTPQSNVGRASGPIITRADINARDKFGRTLLHHASSSYGENATEFVRVLLEIPTIDLYIQDTENGWTAFHRALYAGNIQIAQALLTRDIMNAADFSSQSRTQTGGLVKIKDHEGNSPFEVFGMTIAPRDLLEPSQDAHLDSADEDNNSVDIRDDAAEESRPTRSIRPQIDLRGDAAYTFGSNKNLSLGLGDEDDRQFPERIQLQRPEHLLWRLYEDYKTERWPDFSSEDPKCVGSLHQPEALPAIIRHKPFKIQDIVMAKLHTAVLTDDPVSNLHICGFGPGGRLGTGDETTRFNYVCIQAGGLASRKVLSIALGQDHCVVICSSGEVFTWGGNKHGQLGYVLPEVSSKETPMQLTPRQLYGLVKKENFIGAAASAIHSVIYTATGLYTFGKNEGQLGLMDADARSLKIQEIPRRIGVSLLQSQIRSVSAIDRATIVLLESRDVIVFTHYGFTKVAFPLEELSIFSAQALPTRYSREANSICKITSGGNTIGALSTFGQLFTVDVPKPSEAVSSTTSTTNPTKARNALPPANSIWTIKKSHMAATDVAMGQDGSIILCTEAGAVWKKEKRANIKSVHLKGFNSSRTKDYKFVRVPHLTRVTAVRSNAFGAFTAVRKDCDVTRDQVLVDDPSLLHNLFPLLSFSSYGSSRTTDADELASEPELRYCMPSKRGPSTVLIKDAILKIATAEVDFAHLLQQYEPLSESQYDVWITSNVTNVRIPAHSTILKARSRVLRSCLADFHQVYFYSIPEVLFIEYGESGEIELKFIGADFLTLVNLVLYVYTESLADVWHHTSRALHLAPRYRQIRIELMKIASSLELHRLERAVRVMVDPMPCLMHDLELAYMDPDFYSNADVIIDLASGAERPAHSIILSSRCPFFEGLFHGRAAGLWLISRKNVSDGVAEHTRVDLKHVEEGIFDIVLRHIYADAGSELFDNLVTNDLDEFIDTVIEVMSVANELMLERLVQICHYVIGQYVDPRNICGLLNALAETSVEDFKRAALEYLCLNLEGMLEQRCLSDLQQHLLEELDETVQENQLAFMPFIRSNKTLDDLIERHPDLPERLELSRQRRIDSMRLQNRHIEEDVRPAPRIRIGSYDNLASSPVSTRRVEPRSETASPRPSPALTPNDIGEDLQFNMEEDGIAHLSKSLGSNKSPLMSPREKHPLIPIDNSPGLISRTAAVLTDSFPPTSTLNEEKFSPLPESRISGFDISKAAWKPISIREGRADLRVIMEQASGSRVSSLTQAIKTTENPKSSIQKMSQKERKRQQQQSKTELEQAQKEGPLPPGTAGSGQSPWTRVGSSSKPSLTTLLAESSNVPNTPSPPQRPQMPSRQMVSSTSVLEKDQPAKQQRSISGVVPTQAKITPVPQIQSIRHTPQSTRALSFVDAHTSMADILAQQQGEKTAIKEAAAKRSLQEIQQEQEFQEWWDQESRRVQEEEAAVANSKLNTRSIKPGRGKGNRRKGTMRGGALSATTDKDSKFDHPNHAPSSADGPAVRGEGEARGRGRGGHNHDRGRGRDRPRHDHENKPTT